MLPPIPPPYRNIVIDPGDKHAPTLRTVDPGNFISSDPETIAGFGEFAWWRERRRLDRFRGDRDTKETDRLYSIAAENAMLWCALARTK